MKEETRENLAINFLELISKMRVIAVLVMIYRALVGLNCATCNPRHSRYALYVTFRYMIRLHTVLLYEYCNRCIDTVRFYCRHGNLS